MKNGRFNWYLLQDFMDQYEIPIAPLSVAFDDGETFTENDNVPIERFYNKMASSKTFPTTSQPAIGEWIENYEKLRDKGYTDIIVIALSSGISGTINQLHKWRNGRGCQCSYV